MYEGPGSGRSSAAGFRVKREEGAAQTGPHLGGESRPIGIKEDG